MFNEPAHMVNPGFPADKSKERPSAETWGFIKEIERGKFADLEGMTDAELERLMRRLHDAWFDFPEAREDDPLGIRAEVIAHSSRFKDAYQTIGALAHNVIQEQNARSAMRDRLRSSQRQRVQGLYIFGSDAQRFCEQMSTPLMREFSYPEPKQPPTAEDITAMDYRALDDLVSGSDLRINRLMDEARRIEKARANITKLVVSGVIDDALADLELLAENRRAAISNAEESRAVAQSELERRTREAAAKKQAEKEAPGMLAELQERIAELEKQAAGAC